jgi:hypothetical protein
LSVETLIPAVFSSFIELISAPIKNPVLLWQIGPLLALWLTLELYFGYYKHESLGWNTALGNGVSLFWVVIGTTQYVWTRGYSDEYLFIFVFLGIMVLYASFIVFITFKHFLSQRVAFFVASPPIIYYSSIMVILITYEAVLLTGPMIIAMIILFIFFLLLKILVQHKLPDKSSSEDISDTDNFEIPKSKKNNFDNFSSKNSDVDLGSDFSKDLFDVSDYKKDSSFDSDIFNHDNPSQNPAPQQSRYAHGLPRNQFQSPSQQRMPFSSFQQTQQPHQQPHQQYNQQMRSPNQMSQSPNQQMRMSQSNTLPSSNQQQFPLRSESELRDHRFNKKKQLY